MDSWIRDVYGITVQHDGEQRLLGRLIEEDLPNVGRKFVSEEAKISRWKARKAIEQIRDEEPGQQFEERPTIEGATSDADFNLDRAIEEQARRFKDKSQRAEKKTNQRILFDGGPICLVFVGDQHIGNAGTDIERVFDEQETVLNTPNAYAWEMGDVVDSFVVDYLQRKNAKEAAPIWEQWRVAEKYLERWEDRIVAYTSGNHENWVLQQVQIPYSREICPDGILYDGNDIKAEVRVGDASFDIWARHKWKGNSIYNPTHGPERAMRFQDPSFDLYVGAHTHEGSMFREVIHEGKRKAAIQIGSFKVHDDYVRESGFPPSDGSTSCAVILYEDGSFHGMADLDAAQHIMKALN